MNMFIKEITPVAAPAAAIVLAAAPAAGALGPGDPAAFAAGVWILPVLTGTLFLAAILRSPRPQKENP
jgi:hypothetical protein